MIDLDIQKFFDSVPWDLVVKAVRAHTEDPWVVLYVKRWLQAPVQQSDGTMLVRDRGTPQGSAVSPVLANLFLHYAFDAWMARRFPGVAFERYVDDAVVPCVSEAQARLHGVKELRDIEVDNPVVLEAPFPAHRDRIQRPPSGTVGIGVVVEQRVHDRLQH